MNVLVVDDEQAVLEVVSRRLLSLEHTVQTAETVDAAEAVLRGQEEIDIVITDICMPGRDGMELLQLAKQLRPRVEVILMTGYAEVDSAISAVDAAAFAYLRKPFCVGEFTKVVDRAARQIELCRENERHHRQLEELVGKLEASECRYRSLIEGLGHAVIATDRDLIVRSASQRCQQILGFAPEELIGTRIDALRPAQDAPGFREQIEGLIARRTGVVHLEGRVLRPDGSTVETEEVAIPRGDTASAGEAGGIFWIIEDNSRTCRLRAEAELARDYLDAVRRSRCAGRKIVGESRAIKDVLRMIQSIAGASASVLVCGESGTGKELVAESVHINSRRADKPFVVVNCATLQDSLLESELFGYKQGAFTSANRDKRGLVEIAHGGTLFVDEVAEMSPAVQAKLLRFLETGEFRRLGCTEDRTADVRIVAATNRDPGKEVRAGRFREDLLYRLDVIRITVPPLRERKEDIPLIAEHFLRHSAVAPRKPLRLSHRALDALMAYNWPGNIRELLHVIERGVILAGQGDEVDIEHLSVPAASGSAVQTLRELQDGEIQKALALTEGNKTHAARLLGITRQTLISRLKHHPQPRSGKRCVRTIALGREPGPADRKPLSR